MAPANLTWDKTQCAPFRKRKHHRAAAQQDRAILLERIGKRPAPKGKEIGGGRRHQPLIFGNADAAAAALGAGPEKLSAHPGGFHTRGTERRSAFEATPFGRGLRMLVANLEIDRHRRGKGLCHRRKRAADSRRSRRNLRRLLAGVDLTNHGHRSQAQDLSGVKHGLLNGLAIDEGAVGGIEIPDGDDSILQFNLAMMAGNGIVPDLKIIVLDAPQPVQSRFEQDFLQAVRTSFHAQSHHKSNGLNLSDEWPSISNQV